MAMTIEVILFDSSSLLAGLAFMFSASILLQILGGLLDLTNVGRTGSSGRSLAFEVSCSGQPFEPSTIKGIVPVSRFCPQPPRRVMYRFTERGSLTGEDQYLIDSG
ncbi:vacuolar protein sorting-associated protein 55-like protein [Gossypium australe]|uniref:Vacuolar protein sorting-associated protein 55-like protein n=1 Tax=Gossypium australe TaxID=47621 RepID=A0A5B6UD11_9ROSI|nr:vacuolar protein sorting-associated protein 55-like protein [Gossypium australe]